MGFLDKRFLLNGQDRVMNASFPHFLGDALQLWIGKLLRGKPDKCMRQKFSRQYTDTKALVVFIFQVEKQRSVLGLVVFSTTRLPRSCCEHIQLLLDRHRQFIRFLCVSFLLILLILKCHHQTVCQTLEGCCAHRILLSLGRTRRFWLNRRRWDRR